MEKQCPFRYEESLCAAWSKRSPDFSVIVSSALSGSRKSVILLCASPNLLNVFVSVLFHL